MNDPVAVALSVAQVFDACGLRYLVGGSLASSLSGEPRSTLDVDIVVALTPPDVDRVAEALRAEFDVDELALARAAREQSSVNVFHRASAIKVDLFVMGGSPHDEESMHRRQRVLVTADPDRFLYAYTPEDILLQKLRGSERATRSPTVSGAMCWASCWCRATRSIGCTCGTGPSASAWPTCLRARSLPVAEL